MNYKVNGVVAEEDGDWVEHPDCDNGCILLQWMKFCPCCGESVEFEELSAKTEKTAK